jgi:hypothetical protein
MRQPACSLHFSRKNVFDVMSDSSNHRSRAGYSPLQCLQIQRPGCSCCTQVSKSVTTLLIAELGTSLVPNSKSVKAINIWWYKSSSVALNSVENCPRSAALRLLKVSTAATISLSPKDAIDDDVCKCLHYRLNHISCAYTRSE